MRLVTARPAGDIKTYLALASYCSEEPLDLIREVSRTVTSPTG